jgi:hypothetical protein
MPSSSVTTQLYHPIGISAHFPELSVNMGSTTPPLGNRGSVLLGIHVVPSNRPFFMGEKTGYSRVAAAWRLYVYAP